MSDDRRDRELAQAMLDAETTVEDLPDGGYRITKAGIAGVGRTLTEAIEDFSDKFAVAFMRPPAP